MREVITKEVTADKETRQTILHMLTRDLNVQIGGKSRLGRFIEMALLNVT